MFLARVVTTASCRGSGAPQTWMPCHHSQAFGLRAQLSGYSRLVGTTVGVARPQLGLEDREGPACGGQLPIQLLAPGPPAGVRAWGGHRLAGQRCPPWSRVGSAVELRQDACGLWCCRACSATLCCERGLRRPLQPCPTPRGRDTAFHLWLKAEAAPGLPVFSLGLLYSPALSTHVHSCPFSCNDRDLSDDQESPCAWSR